MTLSDSRCGRRPKRR